MKILDNCDFLTDGKKNKFNIKLLKNSIENKNISHAYLFCGGSMELLLKLSLMFSASINCSEQGCGSCIICINSLKGIYSNIMKVEAEGNFLTRDKIFEIQKFASLSSYSPGKKISIIMEAEIMNAEASNRFLKTLEEPPDEECIFILLTEDISSVLLTIVSRCLVFNWNFKVEDGEVSVNEYKKLEDALNETIAEIIKLSQKEFTYSLNLSINLVNILKNVEEKVKSKQKEEINKIKDSGESREDIENILKILESKHKRRLNKVNKLGISIVFDIISAWLEDILSVNFGASIETLNYKHNYLLIKENFKDVEINKIFKLMGLIKENRSYLNYSINSELSFDNILNQFQNLKK